MTTTPRTDLLAALTLIAASAVAILVVIPAQTRSGGGGDSAQGLESALMPTIAVAAVLALSVVLAMQSLLRMWRARKMSASATTPGVSLPSWRGPVALLVAVAGGVGMEHVGAWAGIAFVIASGMLLLGENRATRIVPTVVLSVGAIYLFAERAIGIALP